MTKHGFIFQNTVKAYPCGSDHTPSPMTSRKPQEAKAVLENLSHRLTAVAVSVRQGHSIAFLGDTKGALHKVLYDIPYTTMSLHPSIHPVFTKIDNLSIGTAHKQKLFKHIDKRVIYGCFIIQIF